jgi:OOP family OmpA-OmpF porin
MNIRRFAFLLVASILLSAIVFGQDNVRQQLFGETNQVMDQAKEKHAELFAPQNFAKAIEYYSAAADDYKSGRKLEDIREKLKNAAAYFAKALDLSYTGEETFIRTIAARNDASAAGAPKSFAEMWTKAEETFNKAARNLEDNKMDDARAVGTEAEGLYRAAELEAIKANYLTPARTLLKQADDINVQDNAPKTLERARQLTVQVENLLKQKRQSNDEAGRLAQDAKYEGAHALYLHKKIGEMKKKDMAIEDAILDGEGNFKRVASAVGVDPKFDNGYDKPVSDVVAAITQRQSVVDSTIKDLRTRMLQDADSLHQYAELVRQREAEIDNLKQQVTSMQTRVGTLTDAEKGLQQKLTLQHEQDETIHQLEATFTEQEGNVLRDGNKFIIRLYGLTFPVGKNTIESEFYPLLTKVQDAIKKFPNCKVTIEGHTDSQGRKETNQKLSEARAKAVSEYLMANMNVQIPIDSQGFGDSRPVASNTTPEERAKNRRIDVVITPAWALPGK